MATRLTRRPLSISENVSKLGSDCTGIDGENSRTLNLANLDDHNSETLVKSGITLHLTTDYTITRQAGGSIVTFIIAVFDADVITGVLFQ